MDNDNKIVKYKVLIMIPCVSIQAWIKTNPNPNAPLLIDKIERSCIKIHAWLFNNPNPATEEKLKELRELKGGLNDSVVNYCTLLTEEKANEIRGLNRKVSENVFSYCENIISGGWEKTKTILPTKVVEHNEWLDEVQGTHGDKIADGN